VSTSTLIYIAQSYTSSALHPSVWCERNVCKCRCSTALPCVTFTVTQPVTWQSRDMCHCLLSVFSPSCYRIWYMKWWPWSVISWPLSLAKARDVLARTKCRSTSRQFISKGISLDFSAPFLSHFFPCPIFPPPRSRPQIRWGIWGALLAFFSIGDGH